VSQFSLADVQKVRNGKGEFLIATFNGTQLLKTYTVKEKQSRNLGFSWTIIFSTLDFVDDELRQSRWQQPNSCHFRLRFASQILFCANRSLRLVASV
jgi:hypothetical protein